MKKLLLILCIFSSTAFAETPIKDLNVTNTADVEAGATLTLKTGAKFVPRPAVVISALDIDWRVGSVFSKTLATNSTFTFSNVADGNTIVVAITNTASNFTVIWPTVCWTGATGSPCSGTPPVQTTGARTDIYTFIRIGSTTYGNAVQNF